MNDGLETNVSNRQSLSTGKVVGFGFLIFLIYIVTQVLVLIGLTVIEENSGLGLTVKKIAKSGFYLALATVLGGAVATALIIRITRLYQGKPFSEYLGLTRISWRQVGFWLGIGATFVALCDVCTYFLKRPIVPEFMFDLLKTARFPLLLYFALIVAAPVFEEIFFRGFLLKGLSLSWVKPVGAVILTALCWSLLHLQYDWYGILQIFLGGLLFGFARLRTGSIYVTIMMHAFQNIVALTETLIMMK